MVGSMRSAMPLPARPPTTAPTAAPATVPTGPATEPAAAPAAMPPAAAPMPVPTGCEPGLPEIGSRLASAPSLRFVVMGFSPRMEFVWDYEDGRKTARNRWRDWVSLALADVTKISQRKRMPRRRARGAGREKDLRALRQPRDAGLRRHDRQRHRDHPRPPRGRYRPHGRC